MSSGFGVMAEQCATCIFRPGNLMHLHPGRVTSMVAECDRKDTHITCHETLDFVTGSQSTQAVCRGYYDTGRRSQLLRIMERLDLVEFVTPPATDS